MWNEGRLQKKPIEMSLVKGLVLTFGSCFGSNESTIELFGNSLKKRVGYSTHQTSEVKIRDTFQKYASQMG